jgi:hypothetical protein
MTLCQALVEAFMCDGCGYLCWHLRAPRRLENPNAISLVAPPATCLTACCSTPREFRLSTEAFRLGSAAARSKIRRATRSRHLDIRPADRQPRVRARRGSSLASSRLRLVDMMFSPAVLSVLRAILSRLRPLDHCPESAGQFSERV